jgi:hypothetical protein
MNNDCKRWSSRTIVIESMTNLFERIDLCCIIVTWMVHTILSIFRIYVIFNLFRMWITMRASQKMMVTRTSFVAVLFTLTVFIHFIHVIAVGLWQYVCNLQSREADRRCNTSDFDLNSCLTKLYLICLIYWSYSVRNAIHRFQSIVCCLFVRTNESWIFIK